MPFGDASVDAVLLFGPLYRLAEQGDRLRALREARRTLEPGGVVLAVNVNCYASAFDALSEGFLPDPDFWAMVERALADGQRRPPDGKPLFAPVCRGSPLFTTAYFHRPDEPESEVEAARFTLEAPVAVRGVAGTLTNLTDLEAARAEPETRAWVLQITP